MKASAAMRRVPHRRRMRDVYARVIAAEREKVRDEIAKLKADFELRIDALSAEIAKMQQREPVKGYTDFLRILDRPRDERGMIANAPPRSTCSPHRVSASFAISPLLISKLAKTAPRLFDPPGKRGQLALRAYPCSRRNAPYADSRGCRRFHAAFGLILLSSERVRGPLCTRQRKLNLPASRRRR